MKWLIGRARSGGFLTVKRRMQLAALPVNRVRGRQEQSQFKNWMLSEGKSYVTGTSLLRAQGVVALERRKDGQVSNAKSPHFGLIEQLARATARMAKHVGG